MKSLTDFWHFLFLAGISRQGEEGDCVEEITQGFLQGLPLNNGG